MENVFFNDKVLEAEKKIISDLKIPSIVLMENAGAGAADHILKNYISDNSPEVVIICGKGNNAGDGFVTARHLQNAGVKIKVLTLYKERELKGDALINFRILKNLSKGKINILFCLKGKDLISEIRNENSIIVDAVFGIGFKGIPDSRIRSVFESVNSLKNNFVVSLDCPSGFYSYDQSTVCVRADVTLMMGVRKFQTMFYKGREICGKTEMINIGIDQSEFTKYNTEKIFRPVINEISELIPARNINSHKYSNGKVLILAGSPGLTGAACLCSMSALRSGAGAVITGIPESLNDIMEVKLTEVMTLALDETGNKTISVSAYSKIKEKLKWADSVLIGPGLSDNEETHELVRTIIRENDNNFVLDADAISAFRHDMKLLKNKKIILTPHQGEFAGLTGLKTEDIRKEFYEIASEFVRKYKVTLVLKNSPSVTVSENGFFINSTGRENLATAGSGDVLSGIIAGILAQTGDPVNSALAGVFIHGECGDRLYSATGDRGIAAGDLITLLPDVINNIKNAGKIK
ncbi:MAG TPA: NAD(P)H-hydrate dehydratase [Ignavibacteria bacterium]|nr:NAD(P)H-hydrate dehydratase [Ignavibacteria bacterium]